MMLKSKFSHGLVCEEQTECNVSFPFVSDRDFIAVIQREPQLLFHLSLQSFCNPLIELISCTAAENSVL